MDIREFQEKLGEILKIAQQSGNKISREQVEQFFHKEGMTAEQLEKVCEYLHSQKIQIAGMEEVQEEVQWEKTPLSPEDQVYVQQYKTTLPSNPVTGQQLQLAIEHAIGGDEKARQQVIEAYLSKVVDIACELHHKDILIADTISEGNVHLIMAVQRLEDGQDAQAVICQGIRDGIRYMVEEQLGQKKRDETMVEKVARLEAAIKELTEDDDKLEFSVDELAIFLDMSREEIEDTLRLAGEDK